MACGKCMESTTNQKKNKHVTHAGKRTRGTRTLRTWAAQRGGMHRGINNDFPGYVIDINPRFVMAPPRITVFTDRDVATPIQSATIVTSAALRIGRLRSILSVLFDVQPLSFTLHLPEDPGAQPAEDQFVPSMIIMDGGGGHPIGEIELQMENGARFRMQTDVRENHLAFLRRISRIVGVETARIITRTRDREPWIFPYDFNPLYPPIIEILRDTQEMPRGPRSRSPMLQRGGMRASSRSRSVSPTMPFIPSTSSSTAQQQREDGNQAANQPEERHAPQPQQQYEEEPLDRGQPVNGAYQRMKNMSHT